MSLKVGGLGFILFCYFLAVSTNVIHENLSPKVVQTEKWLNLTLHCNANEVPGATVVWRREGSRNITLRSGKIFELVEEEFSTIEGDPLNLTLIQSGDKGVYICTASNGVDSSVRKRFIVYVVFPPEIKIPTPYWQEHAMLGENATFQCLVEAQPRGTNNWILNTGKYNEYNGSMSKWCEQASKPAVRLGYTRVVCDDSLPNHVHNMMDPFTDTIYCSSKYDTPQASSSNTPSMTVLNSSVYSQEENDFFDSLW